MLKRLGWRGLLAGLVVGLAAGGTFAWAAIPNSTSGATTACYPTSGTNKGVLRVIDYQAGSRCAARRGGPSRLASTVCAGYPHPGVDWHGCDFRGSYLVGQNLSSTNLAGASLARATLVNANLAHANLTNANLAGANLAGANLAGANLTNANLANATITNAIFSNTTILTGLRSGGLVGTPAVHICVGHL
jgi:hypothetical protein